jgi:hypothetical protein
MPAYYCKLHPPRASFGQDMTPAEGAVMQAHAVHWQGWLARGKVVTFGIVGDPAGVFGVGIVDVDDDAELRALLDHDPTIASGLGFRWEVLPMPFGATRA